MLGGAAACAAALLVGCRAAPSPTASAAPTAAAVPSPPATAAATAATAETATPIPPSPTVAPTPTPAPPPFLFRRGVNIDEWFLRSYFDEQLDERDFDLMRQLGFSFVRLPLEPGFFSAEAGLSQDIRLVEPVVDRLASRGLATLLDAHPDDLSLKPRLMAGEPSAVARYERFIEGLAARFATRGARSVAIELMNEPHDAVGGWDALQRRFLAAARRGGPDLTVVLTGDDWGSISGLLRLSPVPDPNVAYTFHFYEPYEFTHQGATWAKPVWRHLSGVPYPGSPERVDRALRRADELTDPSLRREVRAELEAYRLGFWDAARIGREVARAGDWARAAGRLVFCGELGVYRRGADPADRDQWLRDVRLALEGQGIGWALWEYHRGFGLVDRSPSGPRLVPSMATALGLNPPA